MDQQPVGFGQKVERIYSQMRANGVDGTIAGFWFIIAFGLVVGSAANVYALRAHVFWAVLIAVVGLGLAVMASIAGFRRGVLFFKWADEQKKKWQKEGEKRS
jgi:hypothetical protein